jgi:hypothetical protein
VKGVGWGALVFGLTCGLGADAGEKPPLSHVTEGWIFLEGEGYDTAFAAFHDRISGAFVEYEAGFSFVITPLVDSRAKLPTATSSTGDAGGVPYVVVSIPSASGKGCEDIAVSFLLRGQESPPGSWNFWTTACTAGQRERTMALILSKAHVARGWRIEDQVHGGGFVDRSDVAALTVGTSWPEVRARLGAPGDAAKASGNGFKVEYELRQPRAAKLPAFVTLVFSQAQRLVETRPGMLRREPSRVGGPLVAPLGPRGN